MKTVFHSATVKIPNDVTVSIRSRVVKVTGPRGTLTRSFKHQQVELVKKGSLIEVRKYLGSSRDRAVITSTCSHIENMFKGLKYGFLYKMKSVYAHFPINCAPRDEGKSLEIRNFLGEKIVRSVKMREGVTIEVSKKVKDELQLSGNDIESVSGSAALVHQATLVKNKDIRKFLDGIYVSEKTTVEVAE